MNCSKSSFPCPSNIYFLSITVVWKATVAQQSCQEAPKAHLDCEKQILVLDSRVNCQTHLTLGIQIIM